MDEQRNYIGLIWHLHFITEFLTSQLVKPARKNIIAVEAATDAVEQSCAAFILSFYMKQQVNNNYAAVH